MEDTVLAKTNSLLSEVAGPSSFPAETALRPEGKGSQETVGEEEKLRVAGETVIFFTPVSGAGCLESVHCPDCSLSRSAASLAASPSEMCSFPDVPSASLQTC